MSREVCWLSLKWCVLSERVMILLFTPPGNESVWTRPINELDSVCWPWANCYCSGWRSIARILFWTWTESDDCILAYSVIRTLVVKSDEGGRKRCGMFAVGTDGCHGNAIDGSAVPLIYRFNLNHDSFWFVLCCLAWLWLLLDTGRSETC